MTFDTEFSNNTSWPIIPCDFGWEYDVTEIVSSIVIDVSFDYFLNNIIDLYVFYILQFNLVCDKAIYPTLGLVALNTGGPIGVYLFGTLNDR